MAQKDAGELAARPGEAGWCGQGRVWASGGAGWRTRAEACAQCRADVIVVAVGGGVVRHMPCSSTPSRHAVRRPHLSAVLPSCLPLAAALPGSAGS